MSEQIKFQDVVKLARQAYLDVLKAHPTGWTPPPSDMKDKKWSRSLRDSWPDCKTVYLPRANSPRYTEMRQWCDQQRASYWCSANGDAWYFQDSSTAVLFKLSFGGEIHND